ncbi:VOC family protein [Abyssisolibacter fermentans]|uniref:VOC family protein n=1 Tax=Abyssisolibacter fermentans TaxID=1766203 RepID=UPI00082CC50A|nr:VOC family protein [Abyssisolibacter fermentans]
MDYLWDGFIIFLGTENMDLTHKFYSKSLGFASYEENECKIYNIPGGGKIGFTCEINPYQKINPIITLITPYVDSLYTKFKGEGICIKEKPKYCNDKYYFHMLDPNGYTIEIQKKINYSI